MNSSVNTYHGKHKRGSCKRCGKQQPFEDLNYETRLHHGAEFLECIDRKACARRVKKLKKKRK